MRRTQIIVSSDPRGRFLEGTISGTPKPGTVMQIDASEGVDNSGNFTWEVFNRDSDGDRPAGPLAILLENHLLGNIYSTAYADGDHCFVYVPIPGEEFNMIIQNLEGTADDHTIGELLMVDDGTGKLIASSSPEIEPFMLLETITDPTADTVAHCIYSGY